SREGMPKNMGRKVAKNPGLSACRLNGRPKRLARHASSAGGDKKYRTRAPFEQRRPAGLNVLANGPQGLFMNGNQPLLVPFSGHPDQTHLHVERNQPQFYEFG